jgi:uncharacterized RDD family membrane protein YckC
MTDKKIESTAMPVSDEVEISLADFEKKPKKLKLDTKKYKPAKTRAELYQELLASEAKLDEDVYEVSPYVSRSIAMVIDLIFTTSIVLFALQVSPYEFVGLKYVFEIYKMDMLFTPETTTEIFNVLNIIVGIFLGVIVPVSFFNTSLGKKLTKLRVRGDQNYTITLSKAVKREVIFKPISMVLIVGFIMPFFDKEKRSLHDRLAGTLVIKD